MSQGDQEPPEDILIKTMTLPTSLPCAYGEAGFPGSKQSSLARRGGKHVLPQQYLESVVSVIYLLLCYLLPLKRAVGLQAAAKLFGLAFPVWPLVAEES